MPARIHPLAVLLCIAATIAYLTTVHPSLVKAAQPAGTRPATAADIGWMTVVGIPNPRVGQIINPNDPNVGQAVGEAKQWLQQHATRGANISCMNPQFAEKLKKFMEAAPGGPPTITDGYRNPNKQTSLVASGASRAGPCQSYHNYGLAADFNNNNRQQTAWMRANSRSFEINIIGAWDPNHFQNGTPLPPREQCGVCANDTGNGTQSDTSSRSAPSSPLSDAIRKAMGQQPPPPPPPPPAQAQQSQPLPQSAQPSLSTQPAISAEQTPVSALLTSPVGATGSLQVASNSPTIQATSTFDLIDAYANPVSDSIDIGTSISIALNPDTSDLVALQAASTSGARATGTIATAQGPFPQQTFTSTDLANSNVSPGASGQNSFLLRLLDTMKNVLLYASNYLKPFGGTVPRYSGGSGQLE